MSMKKKATIKEVAQEAGVSPGLVSLVLNHTDVKIKPETREAVLNAAKKLHYVANMNARNMKKRRAGAIGLLSSWDEESFVFSPVIKGVTDACHRNGLSVLICSEAKGSDSPGDFIHYFDQNRLDGLIYISHVGISEQGTIALLKKHQIPFVCIIGARNLPGVSCVDVNFLQNGELCGQHLAKMGYKRIAYLSAKSPEEMVYSEQERFNGCRDAAQQNGVYLELVCLSENIPADFSRLLKDGTFDAAVSTSRNCFLLLLEAAKLKISIPGQFGVISLDNETYAPYLYPSLSTVDEPFYQMAAWAVEKLLKKLDGDETCEKMELSPTLSIRSSSAKERKCESINLKGDF